MTLKLTTTARKLKVTMVLDPAPFAGAAFPTMRRRGLRSPSPSAAEPSPRTLPRRA